MGSGTALVNGESAAATPANSKETTLLENMAVVKGVLVSPRKRCPVAPETLPTNPDAAV
jgi:hypothetical protein